MRHQGPLPPRPHDITPIVRMIIDSWTVNKCTHTNWPLKHGTACYSSMGALSIHLHHVLWPSRFQQLLTNPTTIVHCSLTVSHPYFGQVWGWSPTLGKVGIWSPPGLPNVQSSIERGKTPRRYRKCPRISNSDICSPSYGQKKGRESNWQFDSRPLKVGNRPLSDVLFTSATWRWKDLDEGYNFGSDLVAIQLCIRELWRFKVSGVPPGQNRDSISGVPGICAIWM
jgi:hypothetical protein